MSGHLEAHAHTRKVKAYGKRATRVAPVFREVSCSPVALKEFRPATIQASSFTATPSRLKPSHQYEPSESNTPSPKVFKHKITRPPLVSRNTNPQPYNDIRSTDTSSGPTNTKSTLSKVKFKPQIYGKRNIPRIANSPDNSVLKEVAPSLIGKKAAITKRTIPLSPTSQSDSAETIIAAPSKAASKRLQSSKLCSPEELSQHLSALNINNNYSSPSTATSYYIQPLLSLCSQTAPQSFSTFLTALPNFDLISKIGEASYSEVFSLGNETVMKIIPLKSSVGRREKEGNDPFVCTDDVDQAVYVPATDLPDVSDPEDVLKEIQLTKMLSGEGFVSFVGATVVEGKYPKRLLSEWNLYNDAKISQSCCPDSFDENQQYVLLILKNGGIDLESFKFESRRGWEQAVGVIWQIAGALARAEESHDFEHRDLHEGQILIRSRDGDDLSSTFDSRCDLEATIIDFGLSRAKSAEENSSAIWTALDEEIFDGEGKQWDVYRRIRTHIENTGGYWESFYPLSNLMWMHYLVGYIISSKNIRKPTSKSPQVSSAAALGRSKNAKARTKPSKPRASTTPSTTEIHAYNCLVELEKILASAIGFKSRNPSTFGNRSGVGKSWTGVQDLVEWGRGEGFCQ